MPPEVDNTCEETSDPEVDNTCGDHFILYIAASEVDICRETFDHMTFDHMVFCFLFFIMLVFVNVAIKICRYISDYSPTFKIYQVILPPLLNY